MRAVTVEPKVPGTARLAQVPEPDPSGGSVLVEAVAVGVCGTDIEIVDGKYIQKPDEIVSHISNVHKMNEILNTLLDNIEREYFTG